MEASRSEHLDKLKSMELDRKSELIDTNFQYTEFKLRLRPAQVLL